MQEGIPWQNSTSQRLRISMALCQNGAGQPEVLTAMLTMMVTNELGAARKDLALADFTVVALSKGMTPYTVDVRAYGGGEVEVGKILPGIPRGVYMLAVSRSDGVGYDVAFPWSFIIHVDRRNWVFHYEGWAVVADPYPVG
jgi:hypothetical protein